MTPPGPISRPIDVCLSQVSDGSAGAAGRGGGCRRGPGVTCARTLPATPTTTATVATPTLRRDIDRHNARRTPVSPKLCLSDLRHSFPMTGRPPHLIGLVGLAWATAAIGCGGGKGTGGGGNGTG